jgi:glutathione synthase/RimK-type ligase-like ATP-grasp enzyme
LQLGAQPIPVTNRKLLNVLSKLALQAIKTVGINFASVDIAQIGNTFKIMEINSGVMLEKFAVYSKHNYQIAKNIYSKAINSIILS